MPRKIYLSPPFVGETEKKLIISALDSNWIAPLGPFVDSFESEISKYLNIGYACALSSGTAALHLAMKILGIGLGDKVLCPSLTFAATANAILYERATPIFLDSDRSNWNLDIDLVESAIKKFKPKALISVDLYGQSCDYDFIESICKKYNVFLIEDAAEAFGSTYNNKKCGSFGDIAILSFNGNKIMTTSGGGMLLSKNKEYVEKARFLASQSRENKIHYEHKELGYNYRMSNVLAALGKGQLKKIDKFVFKKRKIFNRYKEKMNHVEGISFMPESSFSRSNRWLTTILIDENKTNSSRDMLIKYLESENIESRPVWKPMHMQPLYSKNYYISRNKETDISKSLFETGICLPSGVDLSDADQDRIIEIILSIV